jgi:hypothetical protein
MKTRHFPLDMARSLLPLPLMLISTLVSRVIFDSNWLWLTAYVSAVLVVCFGAYLMFRAKLPLYRKGLYLTFGPQCLPIESRRIYWRSLRWIGNGLILTATLLLLKFGI